MKVQFLLTAALALSPAVVGWGSRANAQTVVTQPAQPSPVVTSAQPSPLATQLAQPTSPASVQVISGITQAQPPSASVDVNGRATAAASELAPVGRVETRPNRTMLTLGFFTFGQAYVASAGIAATSDNPGDSYLWIPVVGPWLDLGARPACPSSGDCRIEQGYRVLLAADGILQTFGVFELVGAFVWPEVVVISTLTTASGASVSVRPGQVGGDGYGLAAVGRF